MGRSEQIDWLPNYRAVLVANAILAVRNAPPEVKTCFPAANGHGRAWQDASLDKSGWRSVAIAAGAVRQD